MSTAGQGAILKLIKNRCVESTKAKFIKNWAMTNIILPGGESVGLQVVFVPAARIGYGFDRF